MLTSKDDRSAINARSVHRETFRFKTRISAISAEATKNFSGIERIAWNLCRPRPSRRAPTINFGPPLFRNAFRLRLSNGATNHHRNDLDAERSAIIATCVLPPSQPLPLLPRSRFNITVEDESFHQLLIFNLDIIYTEHTRRNDSKLQHRKLSDSTRYRLEKISKESNYHNF